MTAEMSPNFPTGDQAQIDETVRRTIDALIRGRELTRDEAASQAGIDRATLYRRLAGKGSRQAFKAGEVAALAHILDVPVARIYDGLGGVFTPPPAPDATTVGRPGVQGTHRYPNEPVVAGDGIAPVVDIFPASVPRPRRSPENTEPSAA